MKKLLLICVLLFLPVLISGCEELPEAPGTSSQPSVEQTPDYMYTHPRIASWLAKKDAIIASGKPYSTVMSGWFTEEEAALIKSNSPYATLLAGLTINWTWNNPDWIAFLINVASDGKNEPYVIHEDMYLKHQDGSRCAFGWKSEVWRHEEIYAMDPRNPEWVELITSFYRTILDQPQHDGIFVDMVFDESPFPDVISDQEWLESTRKIYQEIENLNTGNKPFIFNSGGGFSGIDAYADFMDGYILENFMGKQLPSNFKEGLEAADSEYTIIYAVDTDDSGEIDLNKMRLGLVLSLLNDNTCFTYDFGPRDHGQAWWFKEYNANLGRPVGDYYRENDAYYREFENGIVVASPDTTSTVILSSEYTDITTGERAASFVIEEGDGRILLKTQQ